jgi:NAD(P)-dependent dehydrogenase (short-subunit alcohol dehydrogenase family)
MPVLFNFEDGIALVAGGSGGIGSAICERFAVAGIPVVFTYHGNEARALAVQRRILERGGQCRCVRVDLARNQEVAHLFHNLAADGSRLAHVIYAAGPPFEFNFIGQIPDDNWHRVINDDLNGCFHLVQASVKAFRGQLGGGNLIAITTSATERVPVRDVLSAAPKALSRC